MCVKGGSFLIGKCDFTFIRARYQKIAIRVKHALSSPRPKTTRPLPAVKPPGVLLTVDQDSDPKEVHQ